MNNSEDSECTQKIENVDHYNECVHLVLLHIQVGVMDHLDVLFLIVAFEIVLKDACDIMVVCLLGEVKLHHEAADNGRVSTN